MRQIRIFRLFLEIIFGIATAAYLLVGPRLNPMDVISVKSQIILSAGASAIGALLVWIVLTLMLGRVYCSSVCPIGTLSDLFIRLRRNIRPLNLPFNYRERRKWSIHIMFVYFICVILGISVISWLIEPWNIMCNIVAVYNPSAIESTWISLGIGSGVGIAAGLIALIAIAGMSMMSGRRFCTDICPVGTAMGLLHEYTVCHIEINPDLCTHCGDCETICKSECIKVSQNLVDNARCVRCFDCLAVCPHEAIRFQINRNTPATPLFQKTKKTST
ncbi:MAG: 4Fe-4S binding protein [Muribaculaceae bacterium]|nr:4Fe-4S binding protein [Muribaculaceae bacterium]